MGYHFFKVVVIAAMVVCLGLNPSRAQEKQVSVKPVQAEVRLGDGSLVRMTILQESLDVMTRYGKLTIPLSEIRRIDFGLHLPDGVGPQITEAIKLMGSEAFKQREEAAKELVSLGPLAYPSVQQASRSKDLEVAQRATLVLRRIAEKAPPETLRTKLEDTVQTMEFPVSGRIITPTIRAKSAHFGELALKLSDLRSLHLRTSSSDGEISVDATKYGSAPDQWLNSGIMVDSSLRLVIQGSGQIDLWPQGPGQYMAGPKGYSTPGKGGVHMAGSLLGKIGENGKVFLVGERYEGIPTEEGKVFLHIVPSPWNNASTGSYQVKLSVDHVALSGR